MTIFARSNGTIDGNPWAPPAVLGGVGSGDNAWQLTAATLVALQSVPGLVVLYAGIMKTKWAINSAFMAFYAFAMVLVCWVLWAYKLGFGDKMLPFVGYPRPVMTINDELEQAFLPSIPFTPEFPQATMVYFQFVFAAITVIIMAGSFLGRMNFTAWMIYVPFWLTFVYCVGAFSVWGGGFLYKMGVIDYSGGYVIHLSSGTSGFVGAMLIGPRLARDREDSRPHNMIFVLVGAGLLWIGWNGFNGGDPYAANADAGVAVLNTNVCTATSLLTWTICDYIYYGKPSVIGAVNGMITGLVAITPAAGVVAGWGAVAMGVVSGSIPWASWNIMGKKVAFFRKVDDTLGVFHTHCVAGALGGFMTGLFATHDGCVAFGCWVPEGASPGGAVAGNGRQVWVQIVGILFIVGWNAAWTVILMSILRLVVPLRMSEEQLLVGDDAIHGEAAYVFGPELQMSLLHGDISRTAANHDNELGLPIAGQGVGPREGEIVTTKKNGEASGSDEIEKTI